MGHDIDRVHACAERFRAGGVVAATEGFGGTAAAVALIRQGCSEQQACARTAAIGNMYHKYGSLKSLLLVTPSGMQGLLPLPTCTSTCTQLLAVPKGLMPSKH